METNIFNKKFWTQPITEFWTTTSKKSVESYWNNYLFWVNGQSKITSISQLYTWLAASCISLIANKLASLSFVIEDENWRTLKENVERFITYDLIENIVSYYLMYWNAYIEIEKVWLTITWLKVLNPGSLQIQFGNWFDIYEIRYNEKWIQTRLDQSNLIFISSFNSSYPYPYNYIGIWELQKAYLSINSDNNLIKFTSNFFKNGANIWTALKTDKKIETETRKRLEVWLAKYVWDENSSKTIVLDDWMTIEQLQIKLSELDTVNQRWFTRDELLSIFKVPKALLWMWEGVNVWNVEAFEKIFSEVVIKPLASKIANAFNNHPNLFRNGKIKFIWVETVSETNILLEYQSNLISKNEARKSLWKPELEEWWDVFYDWTEIVTKSIKFKDKENKKSEELNKKIFESIKKNYNELEYWTEDYMENKVNEIDIETKAVTPKLQTQLKQYFETQFWIIFNWNENSIDEIINKVNIYFNNNKLASTNLSVYIKKSLQEIYDKNIDKSSKEVSKLLQNAWQLNAFVKIWDEAISKQLEKQIKLLSDNVNDTTKKILIEEIDKLQNLWLWVNQIVSQLSSTYKNISRNRIEKIARTELLTAANNATNLVFNENSDIISAKEWYTAKSERTCTQCWALHWKIISTNQDYFKKWETFNGVKLDYRDVSAPPLHPNCRCTLKAVLK